MLTSATKVISSIFISMPDAVSLVPMTVATTILAGLVVVVTLCLFIVVLSDKVISEGFTPRTVASALFIASKSDSVTPEGNVISNVTVVGASVVGPDVENALKFSGDNIVL